MKKYINWFFVNGAYASVFILGMYLQNQGLINLGVGLTVILFLLSIFTFGVAALLDTDLGSTIEPKDRNKIINNFNHPKPYLYLDRAYDVAMLVFFVYFGFWVTATLYLFHVILMALTRSVLKDLKEEEEEKPIFEGSNIDIYASGEVKEK